MSDNTSVKTIYVKKAYYQKRLWIAIVFLPVVVIATLLSVHYYFGYDATGGLLGEPHPPSRGGVVSLVGIPFFLWFAIRTFQKIRGGPQPYLSIDDEGFTIFEPKKQCITFECLEEIKLWNDYGTDKISLVIEGESDVVIELGSLAISKKDLMVVVEDMISKHDLSLSIEWDDSLNARREVKYRYGPRNRR